MLRYLVFYVQEEEEDEEDDEDKKDNTVSSNSLKIFVVIEHKKLSNQNLEKKCNNFSMGLKIEFYESKHEKFLSILRPKI